jgi:hypothetical protein
VQAFPLTDVKAFMGHADIQTTMIYIHHVPQHDAAERLSRLLEEQIPGAPGCTPGAREGSDEEADEGESAAEQGFSDAGGRTRTCDTRIMILPRSSRLVPIRLQMRQNWASRRPSFHGCSWGVGCHPIAT